MDFINLLPLEVVEEILLYLTDNDIVNFSNVSLEWQSFVKDESLWQRLAVRRGLTQRSKDIFTSDTGVQSWREYYWSMNNWHNNQHVCHRLEVGGDIRQINLCGTNMIIAGEGQIRVWDIRDTPRMVQHLDTVFRGSVCEFTVSVSGCYIVCECGRNVQIYERIDDNNFISFKILHFNNKSLSNCNSIDDLLEEYQSDLGTSSLRDNEFDSVVVVLGINDSTLCVFQGEILFIWNLETWFRWAVVMEGYLDCVYEIKIHSRRLYLVIIRDQKYSIKVYDLNERGWITDLLHIKDTEQNSNEFLDLFVGDQYLVSCVCIEEPMISNVKVWKSEDGRLISTLDLPDLCGIKCIFTNKVIILRISVDAIAVYDPIKNENIRTLRIHGEMFGSLNLISNCLLLVPHRHFFEVWNWRTGKKMYETQMHLDIICRCMNSLFVIQSMKYSVVGAMFSSDDDYLEKLKKIMIYNFSDRLNFKF